MTLSRCANISVTLCVASHKYAHELCRANHGVILKALATNICGSDQHMVRGRTTAPSGLVLGHEITGEVVEVGSDVLNIKKGDVVSVPFNIACGRCANCKKGHTGICLNVNPARPGASGERMGPVLNVAGATLLYQGSNLLSPPSNSRCAAGAAYGYVDMGGWVGGQVRGVGIGLEITRLLCRE